MRPNKDEPSWPKLLGVAAASSLLTLFVARNFFPEEKKIRHRIRAEYGVEDDIFERVMGHLMGPSLVEGNRVTILKNGAEFFPSMLEAIRSARETVTFENFLWHEGRIAHAFADALTERAEAGVAVHMLQDRFGCGTVHSGAMKRLRSSKVEMEIFRAYWFSRINFRTHRKLLIVDGKVGFIGGACIADEWDGDGVTPGRWRDTHYRVEGPVVAQMQGAFLDNWVQTRAQVLHGEKFFPALEQAGPLKCQTFTSSAGEGADSARLMFLLSMAAARKRICIASAFFLPDNLMIKTLVQARERGVEIDVIAPGPQNDSPLVRLAGRARWKPLLKAGVRIWEYQPARFHCKYMIVDDCWCSVGSTNLDHRSLRLNEEANLNIRDADFAAEHLRVFDEDISHSHLISLEEWKRRPVAEKLAGNVAVLGRLQM